MSRPSRKRVIKPTVINDFDNPYVQIKCDPIEDEVNIDILIQQSLTRFEFILGTLFRVQLVSLDGSIILAFREYMVTRVTEDVRVDDISHYQTITRTVYHREFQPIGEWFVFDDRASSFRKSRKRLGTISRPETAPPLSIPVSEEEDLETLNPAKLQAKMKALTGKGFAPGTTSDDMRVGIRAKLKELEEAA